MNQLGVISGVGRSLAASIAHSFNVKFQEISQERFADSETQFLIEKFVEFRKNRQLVVYQFSFALGQMVDAQLFACLLLVKILKRHGVKQLIMLMPYLPYARQEISKINDELGLFQEVVDLLKVAGVDEIVVCDVHAPHVLKNFPIFIHNVTLEDFWVAVIASEIQQTKEPFIIVSPDEGGKSRAQTIASRLNVKYAYLKKRRVTSDKTVIEDLVGEVRGKNVIIVDDIIDTAGTAINACNFLVQNGAKDIIGCFTHGVFSKDAPKRAAASSFTKIFITNTVLVDQNRLGEKIFIKPVDSFLCRELDTILNIHT